MRHPGSLLKELDLTKEKFLDLVSQARGLKRAKASGVEHPVLTGKNIALVFEKSSTRTRCAFEVAAHDQGAHVTYLDPTGSHMGREESIPDTAKVLGRMFDAIEFRGFAQETVETLAEHAGVPVWNGLTDSWHPTQMLADVLTMREHFTGQIEDVKFAFVGDGHNNVARSLLITGALLGMDVRIAAPAALQPPADVIAKAHELAAASGARVLVTDDPEQAVADADFIYTDVWVSMGDSPEAWDTRVPLLTPYRVTAELMKATGKSTTKFLHCLPSIHDRTTQVGRRVHEQYGLDGAEVTDEVFSSAASVVFDQAENRLHTIKAVIVAGLAS
ncbi:ornithine carbamoyltransferase [Lentzea waywayandensis]|uniref:Ornithine carbamoyltransferase n=1 Tax=Lentzea waywayandensis TaxID=84724 RepID=A0A1I6DAB3_9PSEU|nr:ornithine carbamoyltransferase [Lentzea waywayandensis]SFR02406.1 ornithine carbamoyltransferase [Lentzea waywayandensis]